MNSIPEVRPVRRAAVAFIFITVFLDILAFGLIIPVFPHLIASFVGFKAPCLIALVDVR